MSPARARNSCGRPRYGSVPSQERTVRWDFRMCCSTKEAAFAAWMWLRCPWTLCSGCICSLSWDLPLGFPLPLPMPLRLPSFCCPSKIPSVLPFTTDSISIPKRRLLPPFLMVPVDFPLTFEVLCYLQPPLLPAPSLIFWLVAVLQTLL